MEYSYQGTLTVDLFLRHVFFSYESSYHSAMYLYILGRDEVYWHALTQIAKSELSPAASEKLLTAVGELDEASVGYSASQSSQLGGVRTHNPLR